MESYQSVHQLVTTVEGQLEDDVSEIDAVKRCFPPGKFCFSGDKREYGQDMQTYVICDVLGSMTGAPKLRSVQILDELEKHNDRGIYSGMTFDFLPVNAWPLNLKQTLSIITHCYFLSQAQWVIFRSTAQSISASSYEP